MLSSVPSRETEELESHFWDPPRGRRLQHEPGDVQREIARRENSVHRARSRAGDGDPSLLLSPYGLFHERNPEEAGGVTIHVQLGDGERVGRVIRPERQAIEQELKGL